MSIECVEDKIEEISQQVEQRGKEVENMREKLRILEHRSSGTNILKIRFPNKSQVSKFTLALTLILSSENRNGESSLKF